MGIISGLGSFRGQFGDHFRVGDHFGVGIISGAVQIALGGSSSKCMSKKSGDFYFFQNSRKLKRTADTHFSATLFTKT